MDAAIDLALHPPTVLCKRCQSFDLTEWLYARTEVHVTVKLQNCLDLATTLENQQTCTFCAFVMCALALNPEFSLRVLGCPDVVAGRIQLHLDRIGTVKLSRLSTSDQLEWPDEAQGWQQNGQTWERTVSHIQLGSIFNEAGKPVKALPWVSIMPACTGKEELRDRLLHHPPQCRSKIDLDLVREWITCCKTHHRVTCSDSPWHNMGSVHLRMVDLREGCIVQIKHQVEYFALSYCWGSPKQIRPLFQLNSQTQGYLERRGALWDVLALLPQTIQDAIQLAGDLACRYLWVDALCIVQDDGSHKISQIRQMDKIYSHAMLTIVAAAGIDAWHGLPGLSEGTRLIRSLSQKIGDTVVTAKWPATHIPSSISPSEWSWNQRAWTFQEQICSKRLLIFTNEELIWHCNKELLSEGAIPWSASCLSHVSVDLGTDRIFGLKPESSCSPLQLYNFYMANVSSRRLGYEEDRLNCATGLLKTLEASFPSGFIWGLPIDVFDCAMLFHCGVWDEAPFDRRSMFPSWCWAAHKCHARSSIAGPCWAGFKGSYGAQDKSSKREKSASWIRKEVAFHRIDDNGLTWADLHSTQIDEEGSVFYKISVEKWQTSNPGALLIEAKSRLDALDIQQNHVLAGFMQIVDLDVDRKTMQFFFDGPGGRGSSHGYNVRTPSRQYVCGLQLTEDYRKTQPDKLTFILVAQQRRSEHLLGPLFELILVEQRGGLTSRIQIGCDGMLTVDLWKQLAPRWEFVVLV